MAYSPFRNLGLKFVSIGLATLLWIAVAGQQIVERNLRVPLEFQNVPAELEVAHEPPESVDVRVRGSEGNLARIQAGEVVAVIDLRAARPGDRLFHLMADEVRVPFGVQVVQVSPASVSLHFEVSGSKVVPIVPNVEGNPALGHVVGKVMAEPATVEVVGPVDRLRQLTSATTESLSIEGATRMVQDRVTVGVPDPELRIREAREALVSVEVLPAPVERTVQNVPVKAVHARASARVTLAPPRVAVSVRGPRAVVGRITATDLDAQVDLTSLGPGRYTLPVRVAAPPDVGVDRVEPRSVQVRVGSTDGRR